MRRLHPGVFLGAYLLYHASKWLGTGRYRQLLARAGRRLSWSLHLRLNYAGMFYSLFLPGSVGGDAYKIWALHSKEEDALSWKTIGRLTLLDRLSGVLGLLVWLMLLLWASPRLQVWPTSWSLPAGMAMGLLPLVVALGLKMLLQVTFRDVGYASLWSLGVQGSQLSAALLLLYGLGWEEAPVAYLALFLLSSLATLVPVTVGGAGARELVFLAGARHGGLEADPAVALGLLIFVINLFAALPGAWLIPAKNRLEAPPAPKTPDRPE